MRDHSPSPDRPGPVRLLAIALPLVLLIPGEAGLAARSAPTPLAYLPGGHGIALGVRHHEGAQALARATRALEAGELEAVAPQLDRAGAAELLDDQVALVAAEARLVAGDLAGALDALARLERRQPPALTMPAVERLRARALLATGDEQGARAAWRRAFEAETLPHRRQDVKLEMVVALQQAGLLPADAPPAELAPEVLREASRPDEKAPEDRSPEEAAAAGDALLARGRSAEAAEAYTEALSQLVDETERRLLHQRKGVALFKIRRYAEARQSFEAAGNGDEARFWTARAAARQGAVPDAMRIFAELGRSDDPEWASRSLYLLGTLLEGRNETDEARRRFRQVAGYEAFPGRVRDALWRLGWSDFEAGHFADARADFLAIVASAEREGLGPEDTRRARYWAARAGEQAGRADEARAELDTLAREAPFTYYGLRAQARLGRSFRTAAPEAPPVGAGLPPSVPYWRLQRAALLIESGRDELAALELRALAEAPGEEGGTPLGTADRMALGRVMAAADDFAGGQRIVVDAYLDRLAEGLRPGVERLWWLAWPRAYEAAVAPAPDLGVERELVWAIMREESSFRPRVHSSAGAIGLMQLMPGTAARVAQRTGLPEPDEAALETPETNVALGTRYLAELAQRMDGRISAMIASYNAGPRAVAGWLAKQRPGIEDDVFVEDIPYGQTRSYTRRVLRSYWLYQRLYD